LADVVYIRLTQQEYYFMNQNVPLVEERKLIALFRVEPGSLGPDGSDSVVAFCEYCRRELRTIDVDLIRCEIIPRDDKSLPELEYKVGDRKLSSVQAQKYLAALGGDLEVFEDRLLEKMQGLIEDYMGH
jgi:hypothetical protein